MALAPSRVPDQTPAARGRSCRNTASEAPVYRPQPVEPASQVILEWDQGVPATAREWPSAKRSDGLRSGRRLDLRQHERVKARMAQP